ncbi:hypothetical protein FQN54_006853 [Arachnomyces sp. PD_36]|nr:hypothetical protein FQN54_006853 [Arachnomyces sp. PD_36]
MDLPRDNHHQQPENAPSNREKLNGLRTRVYSLFTGSSDVQPHSQRTGVNGQPSKPYTPRLGLRIFSSPPPDTTQNRPEMSPVRRAPSSTYSMIDAAAASAATVRPLEPASLRVPDDRPPRSHRRYRDRRNPYPPSRGSDVGPAPVRVWVRDPRWKRDTSNRRRGCTGPVLKSKVVRKKLVTCLITGFFLAVVLSIYLGLAVSNAAQGQEFHVLLILIVMLLTVFFCHSTIRLCMLIMRPNRRAELHSDRVPSRAGPLGYAQPEQPIPVVLARDEEIAAGDNSEGNQQKVAPPPPAYGLWRSSVRINPNMVYWQRANETSNSDSDGRRSSEEARPTTANRPPSYISDDGVQYVVEAQPRSTVYEPLPVHPAERGRIAQMTSI